MCLENFKYLFKHIYNFIQFIPQALPPISKLSNKKHITLHFYQPHFTARQPHELVYAYYLVARALNNNPIEYLEPRTKAGNTAVDRINALPL